MPIKSILVWRNGASGLTYIGSLQGVSITDSSLLQFDLGPTWAIAGLADFDGNGQVDLLWQDQATGQLALSTLQDNQLAQPVVYLTANPGIAWTVAATVDFNQDGRGDILWRNSQTGENTICS
ncbi:VCBS repeat-containing protein [bacterium]|nr:VCBS repeat-containing protein [bacterium]